MRLPEEESASPGSAWNGACDRCELALDRVESLLDAGGLGEALRVLEENEAELLNLGVPDRDRPPRAGVPGNSSVAGPGGPVAGTVVEVYPPVSARSARLAVLLRRTGQLLSRCEVMRDRTAEELRLLRTGSAYQPVGTESAGSWFNEEA